MREQIKKWMMAGVMLSLALLLSACAANNAVESLFALPQIPVEYEGLSQQIDELVAQGYAYISPTSGDSVQSIQMVDLDGDGQQEAVALFYHKNDEKPLKIMVFQANARRYDLLCTIESSGSSIDSIYYSDMTGDGVCELVVGWKISTDVQNVAVYKLGREAVQLMDGAYNRFTLSDLSGDGVPGLILLRTDENGQPTALIYTWQTNILALSYQCALSTSMAELNRGSVVCGYMEPGLPALFVTGVTEKNDAITDILIWDSVAGLVNVPSDETSGKSSLSQTYYQLEPQDINGDGVTEIPYAAAGATEIDTLINWNKYDRAEKQLTSVAWTYHNQSYGWYILLPDSWWSTLSYSGGESAPGEEQVTIYCNGEPAFSIYTITGENRENRGVMGNRFVVRRQTGTVYAAEMYAMTSRLNMTEDELRHSFKLISNIWESTLN